MKTSNALVTLVKTKQDYLKKLLKTVRTTHRISEWNLRMEVYVVLVSQSRALRRRHSFGGGAPSDSDRRRRLNYSQQWQVA